LENVKEKVQSEDLGIDERIILEWIMGGKVWTGSIWLWVGSSGRLL
jgi:hypothetical protein